LLPLLFSSEILVSWVSLDFAWDSSAQKTLFLKTGRYIPENCALAGLKLYKNDIYVTVPRWLRGVPSTLNKLSPNNHSILMPFPSWDLQDPSNPNGFKYIQSMEIDSKGRMWIIDVGRLNIVDDPQSVINGPAKISVLDLETQEIVKSLELSNEIAPYNASFLNDIVLDEERGFAYISDTSAAVIIYDFNRNVARRWASDTMKNEPEVNFTIDGVSYGNKVFTTAVDGIALTRDGNHLFYCALQGLHLYTIKTELLRDFTIDDDILESNVRNLGVKKAPSDGMTVGRHDDMLYFGGLTTDALYRWDIREEFNQENQKIVEENSENLHWVDTFSWGEDGHLVMTSNKLDLFFTKKMDFTGENGENFRIVKVKVGKGKNEIK